MNSLTKYILAIMLFGTGSMYSQFDTLNKRNNKGNKDGYWKVYVDNRTNLTDSANAYFYGFELYDDGRGLFTFKRYRWKKKQKFEYDCETPKKGNPVAIKGCFSWYNKTGKQVEEIYDKGSPVLFKTYVSWENGKNVLHDETDFTKLYNNMRGTTYFQVYDQCGKVKKYRFRRGESKKDTPVWRLYPLD